MAWKIGAPYAFNKVCYLSKKKKKCNDSYLSGLSWTEGSLGKQQKWINTMGSKRKGGLSL